MGGYVWQSSEIAELQKLKEGVPFEEVAKALSHRTERSVRLKAFKMGYLRERKFLGEMSTKVLKRNFKD